MVKKNVTVNTKVGWSILNKVKTQFCFTTPVIEHL